MKRVFTLSLVASSLFLLVGCEQPSPSPSRPEPQQEDKQTPAEAPNATDDDAQTNLEDVTDAQEGSDDPALATDAAKPITGPDQLTAALKAKNPGFVGPVQMQPISPELLAVGIQDVNLCDISPLARQRIGALDLSKCDITDLSPLEGLPIMELYLEENRRLSDISALRGMPLQKLYLSSTRVENLGPLRGAPLVEFNAVGARIKDLTPLESCPIQMLWLTDCPVADISPLKQVPLVSLTLENTKVTDISPLAGHPIQRLHIGRCAVADLTPVGQMQLTRLIFEPSAVEKGMDAVRNSPTLRELGTNFDNRMPPPTFWQQYDEGKFN